MLASAAPVLAEEPHHEEAVSAATSREAESRYRHPQPEQQCNGINLKTRGRESRSSFVGLALGIRPVTPGAQPRCGQDSMMPRGRRAKVEAIRDIDNQQVHVTVPVLTCAKRSGRTGGCSR
jgi:hypothetical protein